MLECENNINGSGCLCVQHRVLVCVSNDLINIDAVSCIGDDIVKKFLRVALSVRNEEANILKKRQTNKREISDMSNDRLKLALCCAVCVCLLTMDDHMD